MDFSMPASHLSVCHSNKFLIAACQDGSIVFYTISDLSLHTKCILHCSQSNGHVDGLTTLSGGCTSAALVEGNVLLTTGADRLLNVVEMVPGSVAAAAAAALRRVTQKPQRAAIATASKGTSDALITLGSIAEEGLKTWPNLGISVPLSSGPRLQEIELQVAKAMTWAEARCA